jgi:transcriptional regulator with XRE-family HTH domain
MGRTSRRLPEAVEFGRRVRARREKLGLSQMALADEVGFHFTYISSVERVERNVSLQTIVKLARGMGVDPGTLVKGLTS